MRTFGSFGSRKDSVSPERPVSLGDAPKEPAPSRRPRRPIRLGLGRAPAPAPAAFVDPLAAAAQKELSSYRGAGDPISEEGRPGLCRSSTHIWIALSQQ